MVSGKTQFLNSKKGAQDPRIVGCMHGGGMHGGGHAWQGMCMAEGGLCMAGGHAWQETVTVAGGTHPAGMHSCFVLFFWKIA